MPGDTSGKPSSWCFEHQEAPNRNVVDEDCLGEFREQLLYGNPDDAAKVWTGRGQQNCAKDVFADI